ncbi:hypothetical protein PSQ90_06855 [Devosia rhodophyticola]|uniref:O-antigen ligase domain-containing protein n=1 Tax=Devosia rhodophyticola TaxID=3026423 RepID=A0ABY7Z0G9_9HYPH|nr:hypothetical protein [Devosia rhodophyticola]WDR07145.1 hypothetical protein PSQ90_06855 [Devosia rhodophyticola]
MTFEETRPALLLAALVGALAMAPVAPEAGNALFLIAGVSALLLLRAQDLKLLARPIVWMPLIAMGLLSIAYVVADGSFNGLIGIAYFAPLLAIWPLLALNRGSIATAPGAIAILALCGVAGATTMGINDFLTTGTDRAGESVANPIHYADVALAIGFLATIGVVYTKKGWRYIYLAGPLLASAAVLLSGTRGAVVALVVMGTAAVTLIIWFRLVTLRFAGIATLISAAILVVALFAGVGETSGVLRMSSEVTDVLRNGPPTDEINKAQAADVHGGPACLSGFAPGWARSI